MKCGTANVIKCALDGDETLTPKDRVEIFGRLSEDRMRGATSTLKILKPKETASRLSCSYRQVHALAKQGLLPKVKFPGRTRAAGFLEADVVALMTGRQTKSNGEESREAARRTTAS